MNISALLIARNEEKKIEKTLKSLNFADEIVVILDRSTDKSHQICKKYKTKIFKGSWPCEGERRNYGIKKCSKDWILEIDADEVITKSLATEIKSKIKNSNYDFFYLPLLNYICREPVKFGWMACLAPDGKFCLFRKKNKKWKKGFVHPDYNLIGNKGASLKNEIHHFMSNSITELIERFNRNSSLYSNELKKDNRKIKKLFSVRKVFSRFIKSYVSRKGYKNGDLGILISILIAIYPFISASKSIQD